MEGLKLRIKVQVDSREEFYKRSSEAVYKLNEALLENPNIEKYLENSKIFIVGTVNGRRVNELWIVEQDSEVYRELEKFPQKFDVL